MNTLKSMYIKLLLAIIIIWLNVTTFYIAGIYSKIGKIEHVLAHVKID